MTESTASPTTVIRPANVSAPRFSKSAIASTLTILLIVLTGAFATYRAWLLATDSNARETESTIAEQSRARANDVQGVLTLAQEAVYGVGDHMSASGTNEVFETLAMRALERHPSISAIGWIEAVSGTDSKTPVSLRGLPVTQRDWLSNFVPAEPKTSYLVMTHVATQKASEEKSAARKGFIGFDFSSDERWRTVMERANKVGKLQVSFSGFTGEDSLLFLPVRNRVGDLFGYVVAAVSLPELMGRGLGSAGSGLHYRVFDNSDPSGLKMLFPASNSAMPVVADARDSERDQQRALSRRTALSVLGNEWLVETEPSIAFLREHSSRLPLLVLLMGAALTSVVAAYVAVLGSQNRKVQRLVDQRTAELTKAHLDLRDTEMMAMQSEKMSSLGQMVAGVAHEINTPLGFVSSNLQMLQDAAVEILPAVRKQIELMHWLPNWHQLQQAEKNNWYSAALKNNLALMELDQRQVLTDLPELIDESLVGLERISEIVLSLKDFSRVDRAQVDDVDIHSCIDSTLVIAHNVVKNKAEIIRDYGTLPHVTCSPSQINQVILNIVTNAAQAIEDQGHIWIKTRAQGGNIYVDIRDDGPGIPPDVLPRLFEPFYTTKEAGKGTGLGLSISDKIIRSHGGTISVVSEVGVGTTFTIAMPVRGAAIKIAPGDDTPSSRDSSAALRTEEMT